MPQSLQTFGKPRGLDRIEMRVHGSCGSPVTVSHGLRTHTTGPSVTSPAVSCH